MSGKGSLRGSSRDRALAGFARLLTDAPWAIQTDEIDRLRKEGLSDTAIEQAILVASFFNYFPRVADGVGIEFDYDSPLPRIEVDPTREAVPRIPADDWNPSVDSSVWPSFRLGPQIVELLEPWRALHLNRTVLLDVSTRKLLARIVAEELCDSAGLRDQNDQPANDAEKQLVAFARKLTLTPWAMNTTDVASLRAVGLSDESILGAITLVAHQNTISRIHHGLAVLNA